MSSFAIDAGKSFQALIALALKGLICHVLLFCKTYNFFILHPCISVEYWKNSFKYTGMRSYMLLSVIIALFSLCSQEALSPHSPQFLSSRF